MLALSWLSSSGYCRSPACGLRFLIACAVNFFEREAVHEVEQARDIFDICSAEAQFGRAEVDCCTSCAFVPCLYHGLRSGSCSRPPS